MLKMYISCNLANKNFFRILVRKATYVFCWGSSLLVAPIIVVAAIVLPGPKFLSGLHDSLINVIDVPIPLTTIPVSPSKSNFCWYLEC